MLLKKPAKHNIWLTYGQRTKCIDVKAVMTVTATGAQIGADVSFQLSQHRSGQTPTPTTADFFGCPSCLRGQSDNYYYYCDKCCG